MELISLRERYKAMLNLPNALTLIRIAMIPMCFFALMYQSGQDPQWRIISWWGFFLVGMTDILDGRLARSRKQITELGKFLDPVADKLLIGSALVGLSLLGDLPWWITVVILGRELAVTLLRLVVVQLGGRIIPASRGGKLKTLTQGFATGFYVLPLVPELHTARDLFMYLAIAITVATGVEYFVKINMKPRELGARSPMSVITEVLETLREHKQTLATAESITGGLLSGAITDIAGSSDVFLGGVIAYHRRIKTQMLGVDPELVSAYGVVSREVAIAMATGAQERFGSNWAISTTGVAGPGPSAGVPAGTVWIAIVGPMAQSPIYAEQLNLPGNRQEVRAAAIARAFAAFTRILRG